MPEKIKRPNETTGITHRFHTSCGHIYIVTGRNKEGVLIEIFAYLGKAGGCAAAHNEAVTRAISLGLKCGVPIEDYAEQLNGIRCPSSSIEDGIEILSCADAIAKVLKMEANNGSH